MSPSDQILAQNPAVAKQIFQGAQKGKSREGRSPTGNVLGAAAKNLGTQIIFLGAPGCWVPVRQQPRRANETEVCIGAWWPIKLASNSAL